MTKSRPSLAATALVLVDLEHDPVDPYDLDRRYWESLRHQPISVKP